MDRSHLNQKHMKNVNCLQEFVFRKSVHNIHHLHGHMPGDAFFTGQLQCQYCPVRNRTNRNYAFFQFVKDSEQTKSNMFVFCMVLIFALIFMTFGRHLLDRWKSHETSFTCMSMQNFWFLQRAAMLALQASVCLSVTRWYCVKTTACSTVQSALSDSKMCLVL